MVDTSQDDGAATSGPAPIAVAEEQKSSSSSPSSAQMAEAEVAKEKEEGEGIAVNQLGHPSDTSAQWLFQQSDMSDTPSVLVGGLNMDQERISRWKGIQLLFNIGDYMRLHNHVTTTASIFFHRFFMRKAMPKDPRERIFDTFPFFELAPTCIFLACKVEETHRKLHHVIEATMAVLDRSPQGQELAEARAYQANKSSREYGRWKDLVLLNEERLLEALCFDLIVEQAHPIAIKAVKRMGAPRSLAQLTVIYCNCLLYGAVCTFYDAPILAACAFARACEAAEAKPSRFDRRPEVGDEKGARAWYEYFGVDEDEVEEAKDDINAHMMFHEERLLQSSSKQQQQQSGTPTHHQPASAPRSSLPTPLGSHGEIGSPLRTSVTSSALNATPRPPTQSPPPIPAAASQHVEPKHQVSFASPPAAASSNGRIAGEQDSTMRPPSRHGSKGVGPPPPLMGAARRSSLSLEGSAAEEGQEAKEDVVMNKLEEEQKRTEEAQQHSNEESAEEGEV